MVDQGEDPKMSVEINKLNMPMERETLLSSGVSSSSRMAVEAAVAPKRDYKGGIIPTESSPKKVIKIVVI